MRTEGRDLRRLLLLWASGSAAALLGAAGLVVTFSWAPRLLAAQDQVFADAEDAELVESGRRVYVAECAGCHGVDLKGELNWQVMAPGGRVKAPPQDETGHAFEHSDAELFLTVKDGVWERKGERDVVSMPAFTDRLQDRQILAALAYIKSRWPIAVRASQATRNPGFRGMPATDDWTFAGECRTVDGRRVGGPARDGTSTTP